MHVIVTGASSGIGEAIAREYLARGAHVTLVARRTELLEKVAAGGAARAHVVTADLGAEGARFDWIDEAEAKLGPTDVLVNNAGVQIVKNVTDTEWSEVERLLRVDLHVPLRLTKLMLHRMIPRRAGTIVDIASIAAMAPTPGMVFYNAAKAGLAAASESLRSEVKRHGIHVVTVYPGPVKSAMEAAGVAAYEDRVTIRNTPTGSPDVLARRIADAVAKKRPRVVYPRLYGITRHLPNATRWALDTLTPPLKS